MEYRNFPSKNFSLKLPKNIVGEPFSPSLILGIEKIYASDAYVTIFRPKILCLTVPRNFVGESVSPSLISGIEKIYASEGYLTIFRRNNFVSQYQNIS